MDSTKFVEGLRQQLIVEAVQTYVSLFESTQPNEATDPYWIDALHFFQLLDEKNRNVFFSILRQIGVDTVSEFLGVLDGLTLLDGQTNEFLLKEQGDKKKLNGDLQDIFLKMEGI